MHLEPIRARFSILSPRTQSDCNPLQSTHRAPKHSLAALIVFGCLFTAACYPETPEIGDIIIKDDDVDMVVGRGTPGWKVKGWYRQRYFEEGPLDGSWESGGGFQWGSWIVTSSWTQLCDGPYHPCPIVDPQGDWAIADLDNTHPISVISAPDCGGATCDGIHTEFVFRARNPSNGQWTSWPSVPVLYGLDLIFPIGGGSNIANTEARVGGAKKLLISALDGPNDTDDLSTFLDVDDHHVTLPFAGFEPGDIVTWSTTYPAQRFLPPAIAVAAPFSANGNPEFAFVGGMVQATTPGAAILTTTVGDRGAIPDLTVGVRGHIDQRVNLEVEFDLCNICSVYSVPYLCTACGAANCTDFQFVPCFY